MPDAIAIIPARYGSTRFPGKPLADDTGKPLIRHVVEAVDRAPNIARVVVGTDDQRILDAVEAFGGRAVMTSPDHPNGTCRIAEVIDRLESEGVTAPIIVNIQGDEPEIEPAVIDAMVRGLEADEGAQMSTIASAFTADEEPADPNITKVVTDLRDRALYFSRLAIPFDRDGAGRTVLKHAGIYAYRREFLREYVTLPATPHEQAEKLEQLRALEHGHVIAVVRASIRHHGIDTPEQYRDFVERWRAGEGR